ncbi:MAG: sialate O-acetylesterase [Bacteroidales bacterium]|nr:sialate O-acetylesterase [Bacteroidales bacterium]
MKKAIISLSAGLVLMSSLCLDAKVRLPNALGDGMMLQQECDAALWGWTEKGRTVRVSVSWSRERYSAKADAEGKFMLKVKTPSASFTPHTIVFNDGEKVTVSDVIVGDIWICGGQSNMGMPLAGYTDCPVEGYGQAMVDAVNSGGVRYLKVPPRMSMTPEEDAECRWKGCSPSTVGYCDAIPYFFGSLLYRTLGIPIGLVEANMGGTCVESWLDEENLRAHTDEPLDGKAIGTIRPEEMRPLVWGNGTFWPIRNYTARGIIWYQGESNIGHAREEYPARLALLTAQWREGIGRGDNVPFYYVEIAPHSYDDPDGTGAALMRETQFSAMAVIPNSSMICTNDCVYDWEINQIHPSQKRKVGERLALVALNKTYGMSEIECESPRFREMKTEGSRVRVYLDNASGGLYRSENLTGFELAGEDRVFHPATARRIFGDCIELSAPQVGEPVAVRYCFRNFQLGNVANTAGLPLYPFRTDKW